MSFKQGAFELLGKISKATIAEIGITNESDAYIAVDRLGNLIRASVSFLRIFTFKTIDSMFHQDDSEVLFDNIVQKKRVKIMVRNIQTNEEYILFAFAQDEEYILLFKKHESNELSNLMINISNYFSKSMQGLSGLNMTLNNSHLNENDFEIFKLELEQEMFKQERMMTQLRDFVSFEDKTMPILDDNIDMYELVKNTILTANEIGDDVSINFTTTDKNCIVACNRQHVQTLFGNLLSNALCYRSKDSKTPVAITMTKKEICFNGNVLNKENYIELTIKNPIDGFNGKELVKNGEIYKLYKTRQLDNYAAGAGLGLALCKHITEIYGGKIEIKSDWKKYFSVTIILPEAFDPEILEAYVCDNDFNHHHHSENYKFCRVTLAPIATKSRKNMSKHEFVKNRG